MATYHIIYNNQEIGPMTLDQLKAYNITPNSMVKVDGGPWVSAFSVPEVMSVISNNPYTPAAGAKDHTVAGVLALLIGTLGIQYFYIGKTFAGIITIVISICTCGLWGIITFIQGILMLTMTQQDFERKYVNTPSQFPIF